MAGKNLPLHEKRPKINEFEQKPVEMKYQPQVERTVFSKPKSITKKELMNSRIEKKKEKKLLENKLAQNTDKANKLKNLNKKRKIVL